jgi:carbon storage regulator
MLVLRRKAGEAIVLNGVITIHVLAVEGERVKLGISAPPEVVIVRSELLETQGHTVEPAGSAPAPLTREPAPPYREHEGEAPATPAEAPMPNGVRGVGAHSGRFGRSRQISGATQAAPITTPPVRYR